MEAQSENRAESSVQAKKEGEGELIYSNGDRFKGWTCKMWLLQGLVLAAMKVSGQMIGPLGMASSSTLMAIAMTANGWMTSAAARVCLDDALHSLLPCLAEVMAEASSHVLRNWSQVPFPFWIPFGQCCQDGSVYDGEFAFGRKEGGSCHAEARA